GVYSRHEQFAGRLIWPSLDVIDDDLAPDDAGPGLAWGHGTHVAGIVAVMAPRAKLLPVRVLDNGGRGNTFLLAYAIEWAVDQGADVINLSLGANSNSRILRDAIAAANEAGVVVVAAAGNSGAEQVQYPAAYPDVLGVTAVSFDASAGAFVKASFANYGAGWVDLAAPGEGIVSAAVSEQGPGYASWSGTSMSTAFVSGASALALQKLREKAAATDTPAAVAELLIGNGTELPASGSPWAGKIGRLLDVDRALVGEQQPDEQPSDLTPRLLYLPALGR
ncbi:MAG TPA: S8 family serine peptidase, partial [Caldilineaceae bacterium]|nr:S8 family serine peptidase [Caldilineaceae bacterium]